MRAFVAVLETAPAAYVIDKDAVKIGLAEHDVTQQRLQRRPTIQQKPAFAVVLVGPQDRDVLASRVGRDRVYLVCGRINLPVSGHPNVCDGTQRLCRFESFDRHGEYPRVDWATPGS